MYKVVVADTDAEVRQRICRAFADHDQFRVIATGEDAERTLRLASVLKPDLLVVNTKLDVVRVVMQQAPTRILAYSPVGAVTPAQMRLVVERGALEAVWLQPGVESELPKIALKFCAQPKPEARGAGAVPKGTMPVKTVRTTAAKPKKRGVAPGRIVVIGASTGGPAALEALVRAWPPDFPVPIVVAQHLTDGFCKDLVHWLGTLKSVQVKVAEHRDPLRSGTMYFAPDGMHVTVSADEQLLLSQAESAETTVPSVNRLFESVAEHYVNAAIGILLTGMGDDGALGMAALVAAGARTVAQNQETCAVFGMPQAAIKKNAAGVVLPLGDIAHYVLECTLKRGRA